MPSAPPMRRRCFAALLAPLLAAGLAGAVHASDDTAAWAALRGGAIVLFRHANAPGVGDPPGLRLDDCRTQRNLDAAGQAQARRIGERFRSQAVPVAAVWSSQWCRARDTATLAALGPVREVSAFNSTFGTQGDAAAQTAAARRLLLDWRGPGTLVVVSHQVNIRALTGEPTASAEGVVLKREGDSLKVVGRIAPAP